MYKSPAATAAVLDPAGLGGLSHFESCQRACNLYYLIDSSYLSSSTKSSNICSMSLITSFSRIGYN